MARRKTSRPYRALAISLGLTLAMLTAGVYGLEDLSWTLAGQRLIRPLLRLMGFILVGLAAGQIIEALGWTRALAVAARPLFRFGRLGDHTDIDSCHIRRECHRPGSIDGYRADICRTGGCGDRSASSQAEGRDDQNCENK